MCKELTDIYTGLNAEHKNDLLIIAKKMAEIEKINAWIDEGTK